MARHLPILPHHGPDVVARIRAFDAWDDEQRRLVGFFNGLRLIPRFTKGTIHVAHRHWPHLLCWQWILRIDLRPFEPRLLQYRQSGPGAAGGLMWSLRLLWLFNLVYHRQASDRIAAFGHWRRMAPVIFAEREAAE